MRGSGLVNSLINNLPFELHLPGYNYCGPGTRLRKRLLRGDQGINQLDNACMQHDIAYNSNNLEDRHRADLKLYDMAKQRLKSKNAGKGEKLASWLVSKVMKTKVKHGAGTKKKTFKSIVSTLRNHLKKMKPKNNSKAIQEAYSAAKKLIKSKSRVGLPRIIPLPKTGGILPLIPIFAGLSALGALAGGAAGITKAVNDHKTATKNLVEAQRHNKTMESIAIGKGLYLKPYKKGNGLFVKNPKN